MAYYVQIKFEDSWLYVLSGVGLSDKYQRAIFEKLEDAETFTSEMKEGYFKIIPIKD